MKLVLYFADGFSWQYVEERGFMDDFFDERRPLRTLLGYSSTIMPSILTGRWPRETGIWTEYYLDPRPRSALQRLLTRPRLRWTLAPVDLLRLVWFRIARRAGLGREHRLRIPFELSHLFTRHPIRYDEFPPIGMSVPTLADLFRERGLRVDFRYLAKGPTAAELDHLRRRADDVDVFYFYDPSLDGAGHRAGASAEALAPAIERIERFVREAWSALAQHGDVELLLFSDHGMTTVERTFDLFGHLRDFALGRDYLVFMDSTFARFWFPDEDRRRRVLARLASAPGRLLTAEDKRGYGIDFADQRYGQDVLVADEGWVLHPNYFAGPFLRWVRRYPEKAMHGYLPEAPSSRGVFFYRGRRHDGRELPDPFSPTDIFGVVRSVTGAEPALR